MEKYDVKVSPAAQRDFLAVVEHLDTLPPEEAVQHYELILSEAEILLKAPAAWPLARDLQLRLRGYRILVVGDYMFFFVICGKAVEIRRILYAKRQYERLI